MPRLLVDVLLFSQISFFSVFLNYSLDLVDATRIFIYTYLSLYSFKHLYSCLLVDIFIQNDLQLQYTVLRVKGLAQERQSSNGNKSLNSDLLITSPVS